MPEPEPGPFDADDALRRGFGSTVDDASAPGAARPWVVSKINTDAVDNFNTAILPGGMDKSLYEKNKIVLWEHGKDRARGAVPIGRNLWIKPGSGRRSLVAKTEFADDEFSRGLHALYRDGFLSGWSLYAHPSRDPKMTGPPTAIERGERPELARCKTVYRSWRLVEYSGVAAPGNSECLTEDVSRGLHAALARGLWVPPSVLAILPPLPPADEPPAAPPAPPLPPLAGRDLDDVLRALERSARAAAADMARGAVQTARDYARGRV